MLGTLLVVAACGYGVDPDGTIFVCSEDADCGEGYECVPLGDDVRGCFEEGRCDDPAACPCPGKEDDDFDSDPAHCGRCGHACDEDEVCLGGECGILVCDEAADPDEGHVVGCEKSACDGRPCGDHGRVCEDGACRCPHADDPPVCDDGRDQGCNGLIDCEDPACDGRPCDSDHVCSEESCLPAE